jgi:hypothetical protein
MASPCRNGELEEDEDEEELEDDTNADEGGSGVAVRVGS